MPLQNRISPFGEIVATPERGTFMGNRGRLHDEHHKLGGKSWMLKRWICCLLDFQGWKREVMAPGNYTELFFLDEPTALAAGHRPCSECRRPEYKQFLDAWESAHGIRPLATRLDAALHKARINRDSSQVHYVSDSDVLPDGVMILRPEDPKIACLVWGEHLYQWSFAGYVGFENRPASMPVTVLTPASTVRTLAAGYRPKVHASLETLSES